MSVHFVESRKEPLHLLDIPDCLYLLHLHMTDSLSRRGDPFLGSQRRPRGATGDSNLLTSHCVSRSFCAPIQTLSGL